MAKRSVLTRALAVVTLAACVLFGAPGASVRLLSELEEETSGGRSEIENNDHPVLRERSPRRGRTRDHRFDGEPSVRPSPATILVRHHAAGPLPALSPTLPGWSLPLRC